MCSYTFYILYYDFKIMTLFYFYYYFTIMTLKFHNIRRERNCKHVELSHFCIVIVKYVLSIEDS